MIKYGWNTAALDRHNQTLIYLMKPIETYSGPYSMQATDQISHTFDYGRKVIYTDTRDWTHQFAYGIDEYLEMLYALPPSEPFDHEAFAASHINEIVELNV